MSFDATFWVAVSFFIFFGVLIYFKIPQNVNNLLTKMIVDIKNEINESEKLRTESKKLLDDAQTKLNSATSETEKILNEVKDESEKLIIEMNEKFHNSSEIKKNAAQQKINQMKENAIKDIKNISIKKLKNEKTIELNNRVSLTPFLVPHRDEFSETVGYKIQGPNKSIIFIPDIDKWDKFDKDIVQIVLDNDIAILDGSFYQNGEIPGRDMSEIPHPFIIESMDLMESISDISDIFFIHLNHTNPALIENSDAQKQILDSGFNIAEFGKMILF